MALDTKYLSIKSLIIWVFMAITSLSLILSSGVNLYSQINTYQESLQENIIIFADMIGRGASQTIMRDEPLVQDQNLNVLAAYDLIENVHIYKLIDSNTPSFFASYNKVGIAPVKTQFEQLQTLVQLKMTGSVIEIIQPIKDNEDVLGYVYLRASTEALENRIFQSIMIIVSMSFANMFFSNLKVAKCNYRSD